jgi:hypothetical protein
VQRIFEITSTINRLPFATANGRAATPNCATGALPAGVEMVVAVRKKVSGEGR